MVLYNLLELNLSWYNTDVVVGGGDDNENGGDAAAAADDDDNNDDDDDDTGQVLMMVIMMMMMMMMLNFDNEMVELHINCTHLYICTCYYISDYFCVCVNQQNINQQYLCYLFSQDIHRRLTLVSCL